MRLEYRYTPQTAHLAPSPNDVAANPGHGAQRVLWSLIIPPALHPIASACYPRQVNINGRGPREHETVTTTVGRCFDERLRGRCRSQASWWAHSCFAGDHLFDDLPFR